MAQTKPTTKDKLTAIKMGLRIYKGLTHLQRGSQMKLILFVVLVLLAVFYPPITCLYALIGLIYLVKAVAK